MNCTEARNKMHAVLDAEVVGQEQVELVSHCEACAVCQCEYETMCGLHTRIQTYVTNITVPAGLTDRLKARLEAQPDYQVSGSNNILSFGNPVLRGLAAVAAAAIVLWVVPNLARRSEPTVANGDKTQAVVAVASAPASVADIVAHFKKGFVPGPDGVDVRALASAAGFPVLPPTLDGLKLANGEVCEVGGKRFVRLTYKGLIDGEKGNLTCYLCPNGAFDSTGMDTHVIGGRTVCCGQRQAVALVYLPKKVQGTDYVLVANTPKSTLMDLALKS